MIGARLVLQVLQGISPVSVVACTDQDQIRSEAPGCRRYDFFERHLCSGIPSSRCVTEHRIHYHTLSHPILPPMAIICISLQCAGQHIVISTMVIKHRAANAARPNHDIGCQFKVHLETRRTLCQRQCGEMQSKRPRGHQ